MPPPTTPPSPPEAGPARYVVLRTGHTYRASDTLTLEGLNALVSGAKGAQYVEIPLAPVAATVAGTPWQGRQIKQLAINPDAVSHFIVLV